VMLRIVGTTLIALCIKP